MHTRRILPTLVLALLCSGLLLPLRADNGWDHPVFTFTEENDVGLSDRHYTQGAFLRLLSGDHTQANWLSDHVPSVGYTVARWKWGAEGGQQMFTPENISATRLLRNDRPYGGWLFGGLVYQPRGETAGGTPVLETWRVLAGVVGPESLADDAQVWWHRVWGFTRPKGWRHQLRTEIGAQLNYDRRHRYAVGGKWSAQFLPEAGVRLGNVRTDLHGSANVRAGYNIPNEFGLNDSGGGLDLGLYFFGGVSARAVLIDVFLDGNNFTRSHHVHKEPLVGEARFGVALTSRHLELSVSNVQRTREFTEQRKTDGFTSLTLTAKF